MKYVICERETTINQLVAMFVKFEWTLVILCSCFLGSKTVNYPESRYGTDDECGEGSKKGPCKPVTQCPVAENGLKQRRFHGLERCGFDGLIEKVCCPDNEVAVNFTPSPSSPPVIITLPVTTRKSEIACKEYSNELLSKATLQILGGENAILGEFPHMASLGYESEETNDMKWECGGSLISNQYVLTAAHCIVKQDGILPTRVRLGIIDLTGSDKVEPVDFSVKNIAVHPDYQPRTKLHDIALIEMDGKTTNDNQNIGPACLYQKNNDPTGLVVTGWGHTMQGGDPSNFLQKAPLRPVSVNACSSVYETRLSRSVTSTQICAISDDGDRDTCQGDSGGPLQIQNLESSVYTIVGITSYGLGCGGKIPGIYTRVSNYLSWIEDNVWP